MSANANVQHIRAVFLAAGADPGKLAAWLRINVSDRPHEESLPRR